MPHGLALRARANQHFAYSGRSVLIADLAGRVTGQGSEGFYVENTRLLSRHELTVDGRPLEPVAASPVEGSALLAYAQVPEGPTVPRGAVAIEMSCFVGEGLREVLRLENYSARETARFALSIHLAADFADIEEAQQGRRQQTADVETCWDAARQELRFRYTHPRLDWAVVIRIEQAPAPVRHEDGALVIGLELAPHLPAELRLAVEPVFQGRRLPPPRASFRDGGGSLDRVRRDLRAEIPTLTTTNATVARAWQTATLDLASLPLGLDAGPAAPSAGLPLYQQFFGRDILTIGWQALLAMPTMLRDALRLNAAWQGRVIDDWRDEEPGKMIHQARQGPLSLLGLNPFVRYYGDWATMPDFLIMV